MARPDLTPIGPSRAFRPTMAVLWVTFAILPGFVGLSLLWKIWGYDRAPRADWALAWICLAIAGAFLLLAVVTLLRPRHSGLNLDFLDDGIAVELRLPFRRPRREAIRWSEVARMVVEESPRQGDRIVLTPEPGASWSRISLPAILSEAPVEAMRDALLLSADGAGRPFARTSRINLILYVREVLHPA